MSVDVRTVLMERAEVLIRTRGYAAFSYADLAEAAAIRKASVHHYFPRKEDLALTLVAEHVERFSGTLDDIERLSESAPDRLRSYAKLFFDGFQRGMLPLCGALSAERAALPEALQSHIHAFFERHLTWLRRIVQTGCTDGSLRPNLDAGRAALSILSSLEGGSLVAWALADGETLRSAFDDTLRAIMPISAEGS